MQEQHGTGVIFVTHDLGVVAQICDRATLLYMGRVMEEGTTATLLEPRHPYTRALIAACPRYDRPGQGLEPIPADVLATCRAEIASLRSRRGSPWLNRWSKRAASSWSLCGQRPERTARGRRKVLHGVDLRIGRGETVGIVGESGSGKTTLGRALIRLIDPDDGSISSMGAT